MGTTSKSISSSGHAVASPTALQPVTVWAWFGGACLTWALYVMVRWMTSPDFAPVNPPGPIPGFVEKAIFWGEVVSTGLALWCLISWVILPRLKTGEIPFLGLLCLATGTTFILDPLTNYYNFGIAYTSGQFNYGSWANQVVGFSYPNMGRFPASLLLVEPSYIWFNMACPVGFAWLWRQINQRYPNWGQGSIVVALLLTMLVFDAIQEIFFLRLQIYSYIGADQRWSLFGGHYYQYPLYVGVVTAFFLMGMTTLVYFRDDKGRSWAERGVDKLNYSPVAKSFIRFLALTGATWAVCLIGYVIPMNWMYTHGDAVPADTPAHMINNLCGGSAGHACPGPGVPFPRRDPSGAMTHLAE